MFVVQENSFSRQHPGQFVEHGEVDPNFWQWSSAVRVESNDSNDRCELLFQFVVEDFSVPLTWYVE